MVLVVRPTPTRQKPEVWGGGLRLRPRVRLGSLVRRGGGLRRRESAERGAGVGGGGRAVHHATEPWPGGMGSA